MKNTFHTIVLALLSLFFVPNISFGQLYEVSLDEKIEKSTLIVEGKVVEAKCFRNESGEIYTANKIEVASLLKGQFQNRFLTITTWGGELDGEVQTWTHLLILDKGDYGLFFLEPSRVESIQDSNFPEAFDVFAGSQGFLAFKQTAAKAWVATEPFHTYIDLESDLFSNIARKTGQKLAIVSESSHEIRNGVRYHFKDVVFNGTSFTFNVYVNSLIGSKKLYKSGIQIGYNPMCFGSNLATNGNLLLQDAGISMSSIYDLSSSNTTAEKVKIELLPVGTLTGLSEINGTEQLLAKGKISIQNIFAAPNFSYDVAEMQSMSKFYEDGLAQTFDTVIIEGDWRIGIVEPEITSIFPKIVPGGTDSIITIKGHNFKDYLAGESIVWFTDAFKGANPPFLMEPISGDYKSWTDTMIVVQVPSYGRAKDSTDFSRNHYAGNGLIQVCSQSGDCSIPKASDYITVKYSVFNDITAADDMPKNEALPSLLRDANGIHGISITFSPEFDADVDAKASVLRAINTWKCTTKVNWDTDPSAPSNDSTNMGLVYYEDLPTGATSTILAITPNKIAKCKDIASGFYIQAFQKTFKVAFNRNLAYWHKEESLIGLDLFEIDMESTALHEFGHAHNLNHVNDVNAVMHYSVPFGIAVRNLTPYDIEGGKWVIKFSFAIHLNSDCPNPMYPADISGLDCSSVKTFNVSKAEELIIYPNPVQNFLTIQIPEVGENENNKVDIFDNFGKKLSSSTFYSKDLQNGVLVDFSKYPHGFYYVKIWRGNSFFSTVKVIKL